MANKLGANVIDSFQQQIKDMEAANKIVSI